MPRPLMHQSSNPVAGAWMGNLDIVKLKELAIAGILPMFNRERQLFCHRFRRGESGLVQEGVSHRYTMMTLIGLQRCQENGIRSPVEVRQILDGMLADTNWIDNIGDLGLLLWVCASVLPERLRDVWSGSEIESALGRFRLVGEARTMELALLLCGLTHACMAQPEYAAGLKESAVTAYQLLKKNQGHHGFFGHMTRDGSFAGVLRGHVGSFADQVYPIYALTQFGKAYDEPVAIEAAHSCAEAICRAQGPRGQWWWHYDTKSGKVFERYPVYSVHQHGMAPMALFALGEIGNLDFSKPIYRGLRWITGDNELDFDLPDLSAGVIWRSFYHANKNNIYFARIRGFVGLGQGRERVNDLKVKFECRPYELGWLLYAFAGRGTSIG